MASKSKLQEKVKSLESTGGADSEELLPLLEQLAAVCGRAGEYDEAKGYYQRSLQILDKVWKSTANSDALIKTHHSLGLLHRIEKSFEAAETHYKKALELSIQRYGEKSQETITRRNYLAGLYFAWERFEDAEALLSTSLAFYEQTLGADHEVTAVALYAMALVTRRGALRPTSKVPSGLEIAPVATRSSAEYYDRSVQLMKVDIKALSMDKPHDLFLALMNLSHHSYSDGKYDEAEELFRHSLLTELEEIWPKHPLVTDSYQLLGDLVCAFGMPEQAESLYRNALAIRRDVFGEKHEKVAASAHSLGTLLANNQRFAEAEPLLKQACEIRRSGSFPPVLAISLKAYANVLRALRQDDNANTIAAEAESILQKFGHN
jgi:tetratricopeptide (TPR) repeat protein